MERVFCPRHIESTPSCVVYATYAYCYGGCGRIPLADIGRVAGENAAPPPADLGADLERIKALPLASIRGLRLPVDDAGFYIIWPRGDYYKHRLFFPGERGKYRCPRGHKKPLLVCHEPRRAATLAFVEGELNALSIAACNPPFAVASPGGVGDFAPDKILASCSTFISQYNRFLLILDKDEPGLEAGKKLKSALLKRTPYVDLKLMAPDANDLLVAGGLREVVDGWGK